MLITDHFFLLIFFPVFYSVYLLIQKKISLANVLLCITSLLFYASFGLQNVAILLLPLFIDFFLGKYIHQAQKKQTKNSLLTCGVILNLSILGYFKYAGFISSTFHLSFITLPNILPIGISFITFQRISYLVDVYRNTSKPAKNFLYYLTYATLFPHLLAGPIVRFSEIATKLQKRTITMTRIFQGTKLFIVGFALKILIANTLFLTEDAYIATRAVNNFYDTLVLLLYFSLRIYMDFTGYSLMAIGIAKLLGFDFPANFASPYQATSITEFWQRWNMTLSRWIRDYIYIPLGGNRNGALQTYRNLLSTMLLAGLWHGASWNFILWGGLHGSYLIIERIAKKQNISFKFPKKIKIMGTFLLVTLTWIPFRFATITDVLTIIRPLFSFDRISFSLTHLPIVLFTLPIFFIAMWWAFFYGEEKLSTLKPSGKLSLFLCILFILTLSITLLRKQIPFIYFQF